MRARYVIKLLASVKQGTRKGQWMNKHYHVLAEESDGKYWCKVMWLS